MPDAAGRIQCLVINSDVGGCFTYRVEIPFKELKAHNVDYVAYPYLPSDLTRHPLDTLLNFIYPFDLVIIQRCYKYPLVARVRQACDILGKKMIFETDDDYLHIPPHNPCFGMVDTAEKKSEFAAILAMADRVTVTTEELKNVYYLYNKNIDVLPNNVENVHYFKDAGAAEEEDGKFSPIFSYGYTHIPTYITKPHGGQDRILRIGYTGTPTHKQDFKAVSKQWFKFCEKVQDKAIIVYIGDTEEPTGKNCGSCELPKREPYFYTQHVNAIGKKNVMYLPPMPYWLYYQNIRNLDVGIAPLLPDVFNMGKSSIKAVEYASWGIPAVLPNYVTYDREFVDGKSCLMYHNDREFYDGLMTMVDDVDLRDRLGNNAREHVRLNRLEHLPHNSGRRSQIYHEAVYGSKPLRVFKRKPKDEETQAVGT